jgi:hypothetical protein
VGHVDGFSIRVYRSDDTITDAFREFCAIMDALESYPVLDEFDYADREYEATLENYASEMRREKNLPSGWTAEVYSWFNDHGLHRYTENRDDQGGYAPEEAIVQALQDLGLLPSVEVERAEEVRS